MDSLPVSDDLLAQARAHAQSGAWIDLRELLAEREQHVRGHPELATLRAEAELRTGHPCEARAWLSSMLAAIERSGDRTALRRALNQLGVADVELGALDDAELTFWRALELARLDADDLLTARATNNLGAIANIRGRRDEALMLYQLAIPAYQRLGHAKGLAESYHNMAISLRHAGHLEHANECELEAIRYASDAKTPSLVALARLGRAEIALLSGDAPLAEAGARYVAGAFAAMSDPIREADALRVLGAAELAQRKIAAARDAVTRSLELACAHGARLVEAEALRLQAELLAAGGDLEGARRGAVAAAAAFEALGALGERDEALHWREGLGARRGAGPRPTTVSTGP